MRGPVGAKAEELKAGVKEDPLHTEGDTDMGQPQWGVVTQQEAWLAVEAAWVKYLHNVGNMHTEVALDMGRSQPVAATDVSKYAYYTVGINIWVWWHMLTCDAQPVCVSLSVQMGIQANIRADTQIFGMGTNK